MTEEEFRSWVLARIDDFLKGNPSAPEGNSPIEIVDDEFADDYVFDD